MEEKEKVEAVLTEDRELTPEEQEAAIQWKTAPNRPVWTPEDAEKQGETVLVEQTPEDEADLRQTLEEARRRAEEVSEEEMHPEYKRMMGIGAAASPEGEAEKEEVKVPYAKCGECGASVPYTDLHDNGSYVVCSKCY